MRFVERITDLLANGSDPREPWLEGTADAVQGAVSSTFERAGQSGATMRKTPCKEPGLAMPSIPAMILAAGAWTTAAVLDLVGDDKGAATAIGFGILSSVPAASAGLADWRIPTRASRAASA